VQDDRLVTVPLAEAVGRQKFVPSDGYEIVTARAMGICLGC
jgi:hypothetical protein